MEKLSINHWDEQDRPREKMMRLGAAALSDAELLAILIGSGSDRQSAVDLMRTVLSDCNYNLNTLGKKTVNELCRYHGMGPAKAITILAACELGKRRKDSVAEERPDLGSATAIYNLMHPSSTSRLNSSRKSASVTAASRRPPSTYVSSSRTRYSATPQCLPYATTIPVAASVPVGRMISSPTASARHAN